MTSKMDKLKIFLQLMDHAYGPYNKSWRPKPFEENKSRYFWTDAYGVCNYLTLYKETSQKDYLNQAKILIDEVHNTLGKTRDASKRLGNSTDDHPLYGGLRIGKPKNEGSGMSNDGQYYHYLTKWMYALNAMSMITKEPYYNHLAIELIKSIHWKFCSTDRTRMFWKMSIDLSRPLVRSEGGLDTYDGLTMYLLVQNTAKEFADFENMDFENKQKWEHENLQPEIDHMISFVSIRYPQYATEDALDAGEVLWLSHFFPDQNYAKHLKHQAKNAIEKLYRQGEFDGPEKYRLAFREFGSTIGLKMYEELKEVWEERIEDLHKFWLKSINDRDNDITPVMYCTSLISGVINYAYLKSCS